MDLSVVIVSDRSPLDLRRCLEALQADPTPRDREILVVDNDSGDDSPQVARSFPGVIVIETGSNLGFAGGANRGLAEARGRYIAVLNPDVRVHPGSLDALIDFQETHPETGLAGPKLLNPDGSLQHSCRRFYTFSTLLLRRTFLGKLFPNAAAGRRHLMLDYDHVEPRSVDWIVGAAMLVRREALEDVGPMDERYFLYFEDVDWCTRMQARGWLVHYVPDAVMNHDWQRASANTSTSARTHLRSGLRFYERWGTWLYVARQYRETWRTASLVAFDTLALMLAFLLAYLFRREMGFILEKPVWPLSFYTGFLVTSLLVYLGSFAASGLYRETRDADAVDVAFRVLRGATVGTLVVMASTFVLDMQGFSRFMVLVSWPMVVLLAFAHRRLLSAAFRRAAHEQISLRRAALLGADPALDSVERIMGERPDLGYEPVRVNAAPGESGDRLVRRLAGERVTEVVLAPGAFGEEDAERIQDLRRAGFEVRVASTFLALLPQRGTLEGLGEMTWIRLGKPALRHGGASKRLLDLLLATLLGIVGLFPVLVVLGVRMARRQEILEPEWRFTGRWGEVHTARRLAVGGWLRQYPLLESVVRGHLSMVGPRPLEPDARVPGGDPWGRVRELHRPGLTGPWSQTPVNSLEEEARQELRYFEDWSPELDLRLLLRAALRHMPGGGGGGSPEPATRSNPAAPDAPGTGSPTRSANAGLDAQ